MPTPRKTKNKKTKTSAGKSKKTKTAGRKTKSPTKKASAKKKTANKTKTSSKAKAAKKTKTKTVKKTTTRTRTATKSGSTTTKAKSKPKQAAAEAGGSKPARTRRSHLDAEFLATMRSALVAQRERLLNVVKSTRAQMAEKNNALPDVSDQAAEGYGDELAVGLIAIEAAQLEDIEAAIERIDNGTYGVCEDTGRAIPKKRLEVLPFVRRCLEAEQAREHRARTQSGYVDDDED